MGMMVHKDWEAVSTVASDLLTEGCDVCRADRFDLPVPMCAIRVCSEHFLFPRDFRAWNAERRAEYEASRPTLEDQLAEVREQVEAAALEQIAAEAQ